LAERNKSLALSGENMDFFAEIWWGNIRGASEPSPRLEIGLRIGDKRRPQAPLFAWQSFLPELTIEVGSHRVALDTRGTITSDPCIEGNSHFEISLTATLPFHVLEGIEIHRHSQSNAAIGLELQPNLVVTPVKSVMFTSQESGNSGHEQVLSRPQRVHQLAGRHRDISRDEWHRILAQVTFAEVLVFEFRRRLVGNELPQFEHVRRLLNEARMAYDAADYDAVAGKAFKALEALVPGEGSLPDRLCRAHFSHSSTIVEDRVSRALRSITPLYHIGRHAVTDDEGRLVPVSRSHAAYLLGTAELLVGWCSDLKNVAR
jgi:hypothetical protein